MGSQKSHLAQLKVSHIRGKKPSQTLFEDSCYFCFPLEGYDDFTEVEALP